MHTDLDIAIKQIPEQQDLTQPCYPICPPHTRIATHTGRVIQFVLRMFSWTLSIKKSHKKGLNRVKIKQKLKDQHIQARVM